MDLLTKILDLLSLSIQLFAAFVMFKYSPDNTRRGDPTFNDHEKFMHLDNLKNTRLKNGFQLLAIGIGISLLSTVLKLF